MKPRLPRLLLGLVMAIAAPAIGDARVNWRAEQRAACVAWRDHLEFTVDVMRRTGSLPEEMVVEARLQTFMLGLACEGANAEKASRAFAALLTLLTEDEPEDDPS
jgi:hypothetical protein